MQSPPSSGAASAPGSHGAADGGAPHGGAGHLVQMANDIGNFFRSEPDRKDGIAGIANHIAKFWTPRMRQKLLAHLQEHGEGELDELPREALKLLATQPAAVRPPEPAGGDAG
jgi:formate dehydrogenase subunit delta